MAAAREAQSQQRATVSLKKIQAQSDLLEFFAFASPTYLRTYFKDIPKSQVILLSSVAENVLYNPALADSVDENHRSALASNRAAIRKLASPISWEAKATLLANRGYRFVPLLASTVSVHLGRIRHAAES